MDVTVVTVMCVCMFRLCSCTIFALLVVSIDFQINTVYLFDQPGLWVCFLIRVKQQIISPVIF